MIFRWTEPDGVRVAGSVLVALAIFLSYRETWACEICLPAGMHSAAELVLESEAVVLGREDAAIPDFARTVKVLQGNADEVASDFFVVGQPPRRPGDRAREIICAYRDGAWQWVGQADSEFSLVVREILARGEDWRRDPFERVLYFSRFLGSGNRQVHNVAHLEVAGAPYGEIRRIPEALPVEELRSSLRNFRLSRWHPLYILLLAQLAEEEDRALIEKKVRSAAAEGNPLHLAAWATAWIELAGEPVLEFLAPAFLETPGRDFELVRQVLLALSVQGTEELLDVGDQIVPAYRIALKNYPEAIPLVIGDLLKWEQWDLLPETQAVLKSPPEWLKREDLIALQVYQSRAFRAGSAPSQDEAAGAERGGKVWPLALAVVLLVAGTVTMSVKQARRGRQ